MTSQLCGVALNTFIKTKEYSDKVAVDNDQIMQIKNEMKSNSKYYEFIKKGAIEVLSWQ